MKRLNLQLIFILIIAACLRLYNLGAGFLGTDEAKTALGVDFPHSFVLPTLSVWSQNVLGTNNFAVRFPFAVMGILFVLLCYFIGKELYDEHKGLIFAFVATFLPVNVILSRTAFLDIALVTAWSLIILFWIRAERTKKDSDFFFLFLALFISPWFKIQAIYLFIALFLYLLVIHKGKFWNDKRFYLMVLSGIPFCFYFLSQPQQIYDMLHYTGDEVGSSLTGVWKVENVLWQSYGFFLLMIIGGVLEMLRRKDWKKNINIFFLIFLILILLVFITTPKRMYYYVMFDIVAVFFGSYLFFSLMKRRFLAMSVMILIVANFFFTALVLNNNVFVSDNHENEMCKRIEELILETPDPKTIYLDTNFGFTYKWCLSHEIKKIDNLFAKEVNEETNVIVVLNEETFMDKQELLQDFTFEDFQGSKILIRKIQENN